jgi:hypothetical protein
MLRPFITFTFQYLRAWIKIHYFTKNAQSDATAELLNWRIP